MKSVRLVSFLVAAAASFGFFMALSAEVIRAVSPAEPLLNQALNCQVSSPAIAGTKRLLCGNVPEAPEGRTERSRHLLVAGVESSRRLAGNQ